VSRTPEPEVSGEERGYFRAIEERFCALRGSHLLLSPRDWALIGSWWSAGVPLPIVLEALEDVFAARRAAGTAPRPVNSLGYVRSEVEHRARLRRELAAVRRGEAEDSERLRREIRRHLGRLARRLTAAAASVSDQGGAELARELFVAAAETRRLRRAAGKESDEEGAMPRLEDALAGLDVAVVEAARESLPPQAREAIASEARERARRFGKGMTEQARRETLQALEDDLTRRHWGLGRIALLG